MVYLRWHGSLDCLHALCADSVGREGMAQVTKHRPYVTVTSGMRGWFAVLMTWNENDGDGFYEPEQTGVGSYASSELASREAKSWAEDEGVEYR